MSAARGRVGSAAAKLVLVIAGSAGALALAEIALRVAPGGSRLAMESAPPYIASPKPRRPVNPLKHDPPRGRRSELRGSWIMEDDPDPRILYHLRPGMVTEHKGVEVRTNSLGFRGPELRDNSYRIVGIGDSTMFGWGVAESDCYLRRLEALLASVRPDVETVDMGAPSYNTFQEVALLERHLDRLHPAWVIVGFTDNDIRDPKPNLGARPFIERHSYLYRLLALRIKGILPHAAWSNAVLDQFRKLAALGKERGFRVLVFVYGDHVTAATDPAALPQPKLRKVCEEEGLLVANMHAFLVDAVKKGEIATSYDLWQSRVEPVDSHPTARGHEIIARNLAAILESQDLSR
ncbi:MAG: SGNH/GDSL hydrolase family protein [Acidobacteriota bacterium]